MNTPVYMQFSDAEKELVINLFNDGKTQSEIGELLGKPRRTIMKICSHLGLKRSKEELKKYLPKSQLDDEDIIQKIRELRDTHSLEQIVEMVGGSISSVQRICDKYDIILDPELYRKSQSEKMKKAWTDEKKNEASAKSNGRVNDEYRERFSNISKKTWSDPRYRENQLMKQKEIWNRPEYRAKLAEYRSRQSGRLSSIQSTLYSILDDLGVKYFREYNDRSADPECIIGPYNFDCVIPTKGKYLVIECQGDYWHTQQKAIRVDMAKSTYMDRYFKDTHELKYIWEHEFLCKEKVFETVKYWLGLTNVDLVEFDFKNVEIKISRAFEYKELLSKYHYLPNAGKGGTAYGAYLDNKLVAVCVFSSLARQNISIDGFEFNEIKELSRLCINPRYQKKNFASWFVSRCIKLLSDTKEIKCVISYCDTTFNHVGSVYKAVGFKEDSIVKPDYWYTDNNNWVMHKKTLYNRAVKMSMTENEYAELFGYRRIYGKEKIRFIYFLK